MCEFWQDGMEYDGYTENMEDISVLYYNTDIIGIASFYQTDYSIEGIRLFYVNFRCTVDKTSLPEFFLNGIIKIVSPGRLLWA